MRRALAGWAIAAILLGGCAAAPPAAEPLTVARAGPKPPPPAAAGARALKNPGFEEATRVGERCAAGWGCSMHADPNSYRFFHVEGDAPEGRRSYCAERVTDEPFALATQALFDRALAGRRLRFSLMVRTEGASGKGAGPWAMAQVTGARPMHAQKLTAGTRGWERLTIEFAVPANAKVIEVGATLLGAGRACFDDARLEVLP